MHKFFAVALVSSLSACQSEQAPQPLAGHCATFNGFAPSVSYATANEPTSLVAVDLTGKGRLDLIVGERSVSGATSELMINAGNGVFSLSSSYGASDNYVGNLGAADFDGDGKVDLVSQWNSSPSSGFQDVSPDDAGVLGLDFGLGNGAFAAQLVTYAAPRTNGYLTVGDFDGDGRPDVAFAGFDYVEGVPSTGLDLALPALEPTDFAVSIFSNAGGGRLGLPTSYPNPQPMQGLATGDFDGDGHLDLVGPTGTLPPAFGVYFNAGDGTFGDEVTTVAGNGFIDDGLAVADFDGDGKDDVAIATVLNPNEPNEESVLEIFTGAGNGSFNGPAITPVASTSQIVTGDFNGDGHPDLAMVMGRTPQGEPINPLPVAVFLNQGDGTFGTPVMYTVGGAAEASALALAAGDFNGDGVTDLAVTTEGETSPYALAVNVLLSQCP